MLVKRQQGACRRNYAPEVQHSIGRPPFLTFTKNKLNATARGQQELKHQYVNERIDVKCEKGWCLVSPGAAQTNIRSDETSAQPRSASIAVLTFLRRWGLK